MSTISKTAAIAVARTYVSAPICSGTGWTVIGPYRDNQPDGPSAELQSDSYQRARRARARWVARIALHLLCRMDDDAEAAMHRHGPGSAIDLVNAATNR